MPRRFVQERRRDPYYRAAKAEGLRSRAAFKLGHLNERFHLLPRGARVLDLGAAPGGWSVVARASVGARGAVVAVDPRPVDPIEGVEYVRGRVGDPKLVERLGPESFDVVLSDMSPRISGAYATDHARSVGLVRDALELARFGALPGGHVRREGLRRGPGRRPRERARPQLRLGPTDETASLARDLLGTLPDRDAVRSEAAGRARNGLRAAPEPC